MGRLGFVEAPLVLLAGIFPVDLLVVGVFVDVLMFAAAVDTGVD